MPTLVTMPKWGLTMQSGTITGWNVTEGESVAAGSPLLTVETEKAVNDIEAPSDGVLLKIVAASGDEVPVMGPVAVIVAPGETVSDEDLAALIASAGGSAPAAGAGGAAAAAAARPARAAARAEGGRVTASPAARKLAAELGVDFDQVEATGPGGRVTSEDVQRAATEVAAERAAPREERITTEKGVTLAGLIAGPEQADRKIVFLHGLGGSLSTWAQVMGDAAMSNRVLALDLPGHGASDKPAASAFPYSVASIAEVVGDAIVSQGLAPAIVVGHSMGGAVALQLALDRPKAVRAVVLVNSAGLGKEINPELLDRVESEPSLDESRKTLELFFEDKRMVLARGVEDMHKNRSAEGADAAMKGLAASSFSREDGQIVSFVEKLGEITVPVYIIWGELDRVIPAKHGQDAALAISDSWLDIMRGVGHVPQVEDAAGFSSLMRRWLAQLPAAE